MTPLPGENAALLTMALLIMMMMLIISTRWRRRVGVLSPMVPGQDGYDALVAAVLRQHGTWLLLFTEI